MWKCYESNNFRIIFNKITTEGRAEGNFLGAIEDKNEVINMYPSMF